MKIDINKKYKTQSGKNVRIYSTEALGDFPIHGAVLLDDEWDICTWTKDGKYNLDDDINDDPFDLVEVKPRIQREYWMNLYNSGSCTVWKNRENADSGAKMTKNNRIACVKIVIDCEEGEGL